MTTRLLTYERTRYLPRGPGDPRSRLPPGLFRLTARITVLAAEGFAITSLANLTRENSIIHTLRTRTYKKDGFFLTSYTFPQIITDTLDARSWETLSRGESFCLTREFQHFRHRKGKRAFKHTVINTRWLYIFRAINLFDATPTFAAFIDSPSRHRETGHVIFIKLPDFLGRESVNREQSFSHIIFRVPVAFPHAGRKRKKRYTERKAALVKITESARRLARGYIIVESISTRVINVSKTHLMRDICVSRYRGKFSDEISATIMSGIYHRRNNGRISLYSTSLYHYRVIPTIYQCARILIGKLSSVAAAMTPENADATPGEKEIEGKSLMAKSEKRLSARKRSHV